MTVLESCGVVWRPAIAIDDEGFCAVHKVAKVVPTHLVDLLCRKCHRPITAGSYIPRRATGDSLEHASCPPIRSAIVRKVDRAKPMLDEIENLR